MSEVAYIIIEFFIYSFKKFCSDGDSNFCLGPFNVCTLLAMVLGAARNPTYDVLMRTVFRTPNCVHSMFETVLKLMSQDALFNSNNMIYVHRLTVRKKYLEFLEQYYLSNKFVLAANETNETINKKVNEWMKNKTDGNDCATTAVIKDDTSIALLSACVVKTIFLADVIEERTFHINRETSVTVDMMTAKKKLFLGSYINFNCSILELPMTVKNLSMFIILPDRINGLKLLEEQLTVPDLDEMIRRMEQRSVSISLPKFKLEQRNSLEDLLKNMELKNLFSTEANFAEMTNAKQKLHISHFYQEAIFEMNGELTCDREYGSDVVFEVDHPFMFFVRENVTKCIVLGARVIDPNSC